MNKIQSIDQLDLSKRYTYADYITWWFDERVELIKGYVRKMSPAPSSFHQIISSNLVREISVFLKKKPCKIYHAPFDVRLKRTLNDSESITIVQPDICIICDLTKIDERGCNGAPEMIIEILSPSSSKHDVKTKFELYQEAGVLEYWIVDPFDKIVDVFVLKNDIYQLIKKYVLDDKIKVNVIDGLEIDLIDIFEN